MMGRRMDDGVESEAQTRLEWNTQARHFLIVRIGSFLVLLDFKLVLLHILSCAAATVTFDIPKR